MMTFTLHSGVWTRFRTVRANWPLYLIEAALLGVFMISACVFGILIEHPASPLRQSIQPAIARRLLMGLAMGGTAVLLIYSRWGRRTGAHMNPAVTLAFLRLGRIHRLDALFYIAAHFVGGALGVAVMALVIRSPLMHPKVNFVATLPGPYGTGVAWIAEFAIAFVMLTTVMNVNRFLRLAPFAGWFAGALVVTYITFEAPLSGMSLNPARTFGSAVNAKLFTFLWIYFTAPVLGMQAAVEVNRLISRAPDKLCGKFSHSRTVACIFKCDCLRETRETP